VSERLTGARSLGELDDESLAHKLGSIYKAWSDEGKGWRQCGQVIRKAVTSQWNAKRWLDDYDY